jgi:hypothetical protein
MHARTRTNRKWSACFVCLILAGLNVIVSILRVSVDAASVLCFLVQAVNSNIASKGMKMFFMVSFNDKDHVWLLAC